MSANPKWSMSGAQREAWNNRQLTVTVHTHCDSCGTLKEGVKHREAVSYYPFSYAVKMTSCESCFETAKKKAVDEARPVTYC